MKEKIVSIFSAIILLGAFIYFFFPVRHVEVILALPDSVRIKNVSGSAWRGLGDITVEVLDTKLDLDIAWHACLDRRFPFYGNCISLAGHGLELRGKLVFIPILGLKGILVDVSTDKLFIRDLEGRVDIASMNTLLQETTPLVEIINLKGRVDLDFPQVDYSVKRSQPLLGQGNIHLADLAILGEELPDIAIEIPSNNFILANDEFKLTGKLVSMSIDKPSISNLILTSHQVVELDEELLDMNILMDKLYTNNSTSISDEVPNITIELLNSDIIVTSDTFELTGELVNRLAGKLSINNLKLTSYEVVELDGERLDLFMYEPSINNFIQLVLNQ